MPANDGVFYTVRLNIKRIQAEEKFIDESFNAVIDDIDQKILGIGHLNTGMHWTPWESGTSYMAGDVIRWPRLKSHQYAKCIQGGTTSANVPIINTTGSEVTNGSTKWKIMSLTEVSDAIGGTLRIWLGGGTLYERGDAVIYGKAIYRCKTASHYSSLSFGNDIANWQEVFSSIRFWHPLTYYAVNDTVIVDGFIHICLADHTSDSTYSLAEKNNWQRMHEYALVPEWEPSTRYIDNQVVTIQDILYRCVYDHVSDATDVENDEAYWITLFASLQDWSSGTYYGLNSVVLHNDFIYKCTYAHTASVDFADDTANWKLLHQLPSKLLDWNANTRYDQYQLVYYENNIYRSLYNHTSGSNFDTTKWQVVSDSINDWVTEGDYQVGQYVNYQNSLYKCIVDNNDTNFTPAKWQKVSGGSLETWDSNKDYSVGDIVINANKIYQCNTAHTSSSSFNTDTDNWTEISACITRIPNWAVSTDYVVGDLVAHDAKIYRCITAHTSDSTQWDDTEEAKWEELSPTINEISNWAVSTDYEIGQLVIHNNKLYRCNTAHTSDSTSFNTDIAYWDLIGSSGIDSWKTGELYQQGSMVVYNDKIYVCDSSHTSANPFDFTKWHEVSSTTIEDWQANTEYVENQPIEYNDTLFRANKDFTSGTTVSDDDNNLDFVYANLSTWQSGVYYRQGAIVIDSDDKIYKCKQSHTSSSANRDTNWEELSKTLVEEYAQNKNYVEGSPVLYNGKLYRANTNVTNSTATLDLNKWDSIVGSGIEQWQPSTDYRVRNVVVNNNQIYICTTAHTSDSTAFNTDIANWGLLDTKWKSENWSANTLYTANEVVLYDNRLFRCVSTHTSAADFATDANYWLAIGSRLEVWKQNVHYKVEDIIINNHKLYRCIIEHTSTNTFDSPKWDEISPTKLDDWQASTDYAIGDYVLNNNKIYKCTTAHTSTSDFDISKWVEISSYDIDLWQPSTEYIVGNLALYDNRIYRCNTAHISDSTSFGVDIANWDEIGSSGIDSWEQNKLYSADNIVIYNNKIYKCITGHTSSTTFDPTKWVEVSSSDIDAWSVSTAYVVGDFVYKNNQLYRCITAHTSDSSDFDVDIAKWELLDTKWKAENWVASKLYTANEVVLYDNRLFKCISTHISAVDFATDGSYWQALSSKLEPWKTTTYYIVGDTVINNNKLYKCIVAHTSDSTSMLTDASNWEIVGSGGIDTWKSNEDYTTSSVVIYNNKIYKCNTAHTSGSTFDPTKWDEISSADIDLWQVSTAYKVGNLVINNNQIYRCKTAHTSSSTFNSDISNWDILDTKWQAKDWTTNTYYFSGEIILYDNMPYKCITAHTSLGTFELDKAYWESLSANIRQWVGGNTYKVGDIVIYDGDIWKCITSNNSNSFEKDKWIQINKCNIEKWHGAPDTDILALLHFNNQNDIGYNEYGDNFAISNNPAMGGGRFGLGISLDSRRGRVSSPQYDFNNGETYTIEFWMLASDAGFTENAHVVIGNIGEVITFRIYQGLRIFYGTPYAFIPTNFIGGAWNHMAFVISPTKCTTFINGNLESTSTRSDSSPIYLTIGDSHNQSDYGNFGIDELLITKREKYTVDFDVPTEPFQDPNYEGYKKDDLVVYNNKIYQALVDNNDIEFIPSKWLEVSSANTPLWENNVYYAVGDIVIYDNQTYRCSTAHTSNTFLGDIAKWQSLDTNWLLKDWAVDKLYLKDQVVSYSGGLWKSLITHESTADEPPTDAKIYEASDNVIEVDDTTTIPYTETIDLGSVKHITDIDFTESTSEMSFTYTVETSIDNITYENWTEDAVNARYIRLTVDSVNIDDEATSPNAYLSDFIVYGDSDKWKKISSGGSGDLAYATNSDIDNLFI